MARNTQTEVLVVGAGPVGLLTALSLAQADVSVKIIDEEERTATHSYACALHPGSLTLLERLGLLPEALELGHRIEKVAFYEGKSRRAEIELSRLGGDYPFVLVLPQSTLEDLLERSLAKSGVRIDWKHHLTDLRIQGNTVSAMVDKLYETVTGYIVPHWEWVVKERQQIDAALLVGADGHNSLVRQRLGIEYERLHGPEVFVVYEFESDAPLANEMRVVVQEKTTDVLWPLSERRCRWSFQLNQTEEFIEFPRKDRMAVKMDDRAMDEQFRKHVRKLVERRAPWFESSIQAFDWFTMVQFEHRLANRFGQANCWLAGDAAHQTGPVGMQSINVGLNEAAELAEVFRKILREKASLSLLESYNRTSRNEWQQLLGVAGGLVATAKTNPWVKQYSERILPCIPASGPDLIKLLDQLDLVIGKTQPRKPSTAVRNAKAERRTITRN